MRRACHSACDEKTHGILEVQAPETDHGRVLADLPGRHGQAKFAAPETFRFEAALSFRGLGGLWFLD
jgi:hypothetical protein